MPSFADTDDLEICPEDDSILRKDHWKGKDRSSHSIKKLVKYTGISEDYLSAWCMPGNLPRLNTILFRHENCMLAYEQCSSHDVKTFARQKRLDIPRKASFDTLVKLLYSNETFHRFLDLPPRLRTTIYQLYFKFQPHDIRNKPRNPPPITEVNHQLRSEALSEFWSTQKVVLSVDYSWDTRDLLLKPADVRFFRHAPLEQRKMIKRLRILATGFGKIVWDLDLPTNDRPAEVRTFIGGEDETADRVLDFLHMIGKRKRNAGLRRMDGEALMGLFHRTRSRRF